MNVLVVGSGGREHALAWKLAQSAQVSKVFVAPGNAGTGSEDKIENVAIDSMAIEKLIAFAKDNAIALTIVGAEAPLAAGIVDRFDEENLACFGPTQAAAQLESSKTYSKDFMARHKIPTAGYASFYSMEQALAYLDSAHFPQVIKADGLAAGKGVIIAKDKQEAIDAVRLIMSERQFGEAGKRLLIEEFIQGEELSFIVITDGKVAIPFASSQDHKARDNGDEGPNTGGMGAYSPAPVMTAALEEKIMQEVIVPTITGMAAEGKPYKGFLYAGCMISENEDIQVLEFNCRFGDPETQPVMLRLQSDFFDLCHKAYKGALAGVQLDWDPRAALGVVMAAGGYPRSYAKGFEIEGLSDAAADNIKIFHAGTRLVGDQLVTNGGRVLCVTALGDSVQAAQSDAYSAVNKIHWHDNYFRTDIGYRAIARETEMA